MELRPSRPEDLAQVTDRPLPYPIKGVTLLEDGMPVAIGGLVFRPDGTVWLGALISDRARQTKVALHKAGLAVVRQARELGLLELKAIPDPTQPRSEAWLARLGFRPTDGVELGRRVWIWIA